MQQDMFLFGVFRLFSRIFIKKPAPRIRGAGFYLSFAVVHKADVEVYPAGYAVDCAGIAVLPNLEVIVEAGGVVVSGVPEVILLYPAQVVFQISAVGVEIDHGLIAGVLYHGAELVGRPAQGVGVEAVGAGIAVPHPLPVKDDGVCDIIALYVLEDIIGFLLGLPFIYGLREVVDADMDAGVYGALDILFKIGVVVHIALGAVAAAADADEGELNSGPLDPLPVYLALMGGDVDAHMCLLASISQKAVLGVVILVIKAVLFDAA